MVSQMEPLEFKHRNQWRGWLEANHAVKTEAWLVLYKVKYQDQGLGLGEAVEEALCFGWIDGTLKSLGEKRYHLRFSPRTVQSVWSMNNIHRVERLMAEGRMADAGVQKVAEAKKNGEWDAAIRREQVDVIPEALETALQKVDGAIAAYHALPASRKKQFIYWIQSAKRGETVQRRIQQILAEIQG